MTITDELINRLSTETGRRLSARAREGRRQAVAKISHCCVTVTRDGRSTREEIFDKTPTLGQLMARVGPDYYVVSISMRHQSLRQRARLLLAAE
jgi:hypothetical protein